MSRGSISKKLRFDILKRDNFACVYCGHNSRDKKLQVDHIIPASKGGRDIYHNLVTSCIDCNQGKSNNLLLELEQPAICQDTEELVQRVMDVLVERDIDYEENILPVLRVFINHIGYAETLNVAQQCFDYEEFLNACDFREGVINGSNIRILKRMGFGLVAK